MHRQLTNATDKEREKWQQRYAILDDALRHTETLLNDQQSTLTRKKTIDRVVAQLRAFGEKQFAFFYQGFQQTAPFLQPNDDPLQGVAAQYVFGTIIDQIAHDSSVLERIEMQRRDQRYCATLQMADRIAYDALGYVSHLFQEPQTVLTYLQKSPDVRVVPYAPVALIGIPRTCHPLQMLSPQGMIRDLLAIPHELGHHLYWNGQDSTNNNQLRHSRPINRLEPSNPAWLAAWFEEIFADVVTCVIGGPMAALSMQELQLQARNDWLLVDDGVHPVAAFRTYIYIETLKAMKMETSACKLAERWGKKLADRGLVPSGNDPRDYLCFLPSTKEAPSTFRAVLDQMIPLIKALVPLFQSAKAPWSADIEAAINPTDDGEVDQLYKEFEGWVPATFIDGQTPSNQQIDRDLDLCWQPKAWHELVEDRGVAFEIAEEVVNSGRRPPPSIVIDRIRKWSLGTLQEDEELSLEFTEWIKIVEFAGWSTEGPTDGNLSGG
jgi:hypothetical protein